MEEKIIVTAVGLSNPKSEELSLKLKSSDFNLITVDNFEGLDQEEVKGNKQLIIVSGEDLNLDLFKENLRKAEELEKNIIALMPLKDMDLLIQSFSSPYFDFCLPPHDVSEITLRLISAAGKSSQEDKEIIKIGPLVINQESYEVTLDEVKIDLTFKEYELLKHLAAKPGRVFSRESLLHSVWEYDYYGGTRTVDVHVRRLRSKINDIKYNFIETVWNVGYRFQVNPPKI
ncbi:MAG: response regulator transcription factor [Chloroflexota bacterium]|nr:response regulator transcription factor [Chloroflexota bacterium]|tara:strand:- start:1604 stop:2293 length:690 start_codon:yes stop_codon:yes gene_type:complete